MTSSNHKQTTRGRTNERSWKSKERAKKTSRRKNKTKQKNKTRKLGGTRRQNTERHEDTVVDVVAHLLRREANTRTKNCIELSLQRCAYQLVAIASTWRPGQHPIDNNNDDDDDDDDDDNNNNNNDDNDNDM